MMDGGGKTSLMNQCFPLLQRAAIPAVCECWEPTESGSGAHLLLMCSRGDLSLLLHLANNLQC